MVTTASFLTPLRTEKIGARRWLLIDDLVFESVRFQGRFVAPRGFQTDLASIPRIAWTIFPKVDLYDEAAVIHDAAYANAIVTAQGERVYLIKRFADALFYEGCLARGVGPRRARIMWWVVSRFGDPVGHPLRQP
jgi:hypothetical protein